MFTRRVIIFVALILALAAASAEGRSGGLPSEGVVRFVADGDTVILESGEKVRYLGIDAPETGHGGDPSDCYGAKAREANSKMVRRKKITLKYDREKRDHYGRLLAYAYTPDGRCVNLELVKSGHAWVHRPDRPISMLPQLLEAQKDAIRDGRGLWKACPVKPSPFYLGNVGSFIFHRPECPLAREMSDRNAVRYSDRWRPLLEGFRPCRTCRP